MNSSGSRQQARRLSVLHVTADYPDAFDARKTPAIRSFIDLVADKFDHQVISLNRTVPSLAQCLSLLAGRPNVVLERQESQTLASLRYAGFSQGILHRTMLHRLADELCEQISKGPRPDLIVGYKLTVEGLVVARIARKLGLPYALMIQGGTDAKISSFRPDLHGEFAETLGGAAMVFSLAPWALHKLQEQLGINANAVTHLPCAIALDTPRPPQITGHGILSAFNLKKHRVKNFKRLVKALTLGRMIEPGLELNVVGGGDNAHVKAVQRVANGVHGITLLGAVANSAMSACYTNAAGFALPSLEESFGMVFIEALFCGAPVVYPAGRAVSGWFDREPFAIAVDPTDVQSIAEGLLRLKRDEAALKAALAKWQRSPDSGQFVRSTIAQNFENGLRSAASRSKFADIART